MPKKSIPRVVAIETGPVPLSLRVRWSHGGESMVDLSGPVGAFKLYAPLRDAPERFAQARVGEYGADIVWDNEIDMSADTLWRLAQEQSGETISAEAFRRWRERKAYTLDSAARALGLSRRMVAYYDGGEKPIPRTVALAVKALEMGL